MGAIAMEKPFQLIFDGRCRVCSRMVDGIGRLDRRHRIEAHPYQDPDLERRFGLSRRQAEHEVWLIGPDGRKYGGAEAVNRVLDVLGGVWRVIAKLYRVRGIRWLEDRLYHAFSSVRHRFGFLGSTAACDRPGEACIEREPDHAPL
jgi:predicted DCC family thiol-disulfide oxidoreductase YuxK